MTPEPTPRRLTLPRRDGATPPLVTSGLDPP